MVGSWLLVLGAIALWSVFLRPAPLGGSTGYVMVSGKSMEPLMHTGDLAVVRRQSTYAIGDVIAYRVPEGSVGRGMVVIHRVSGGDAANGYVLKGDNRDHPDVWRPRASDVVGELQWHVPHAGTALFLLRSPLVIAAVAGFFAFWMIAAGGKPRVANDDATASVAPEDAAATEESAAAPHILLPPVARRPRPARPVAAPAATAVVLTALAARTLWQLRHDARTTG